MVTVPERKLLIAVDDIAGVVDIERYRLGRHGIAGAVDADHLGHHPSQFAYGRRILPAAHRRLAGETRARSRQLAQRQAEARIVTQGVKVIGILVAARDRKHARAQDVVEAMDHPRRIAPVGNAAGKLPANPHRAFCLCQQQNTAIRSEAATVESCGDFLAMHRWESEWACDIIVHGGCGLWHFLPCDRAGVDTQFLKQIRGLCHSRQPFRPSSMNKTG